MDTFNSTNDLLRKKYEDLISKGLVENADIEFLIDQMRKLVLYEGLPTETEVCRLQDFFKPSSD